MALPFGTKVYLEDKTLKKVEDLSFGDKVLSFKIKEDTSLNHSEFYYKYTKKDSIGNHKSIKVKDLELSSATVYSVFLDKQKTDFISFNNNLISSIQPVLISKNMESLEEFFLKDSRDIIAKMQEANNTESYLIPSLAAQSFSINADILNKNIFIDSDNIFLQNQIKTFEVNLEAQPGISILLLDNHFLITENFICFGAIVGGESLL